MSLHPVLSLSLQKDILKETRPLYWIFWSRLCRSVPNPQTSSPIQYCLERSGLCFNKQAQRPQSYKSMLSKNRRREHVPGIYLLTLTCQV